MPQILEVKFKPVTKSIKFCSGKYFCKIGDHIIVNTPKGVEFGTVVKILNKNKNIDYNELNKIIRIATSKDIAQNELNKKNEQKAFKICVDKIKHIGLPMKIIDVEYMFDNKKILFYFSADGKIDFRDLVKELAVIFKTRIELRQIGVRDQAKILGGLGICGNPFCCITFLNDFSSVSIKMAKEQCLSLSPIKISGTCGRLMCCLQYEQEAYEDLIKNTPCLNSYVSTIDGEGTVIDVNLITGFLKVMLDDERQTIPQVYHKDDVKILKI